MSSAGWFKRAKHALALVEFLDKLSLWTGPDGILDLIDSTATEREHQAQGRQLLSDYRRTVVANPLDRDREPRIRRRGPKERRTRTDAGRETDARDAVPARPW